MKKQNKVILTIVALVVIVAVVLVSQLWKNNPAPESSNSDSPSIGTTASASVINE